MCRAIWPRSAISSERSLLNPNIAAVALAADSGDSGLFPSQIACRISEAGLLPMSLGGAAEVKGFGAALRVSQPAVPENVRLAVSRIQGPHVMQKVPAVQLTLDSEALTPLIREIVRETVTAIQDAQGAVPERRLAYSEEEAARLLGLQPHQLRDERRRGMITHTKIVGGRIRYVRDDLTRYLAERSKQPPVQGKGNIRDAVAGEPAT